jgi:predicted peptidase
MKKRILEIYNLEEEFNIDKDRIYVAGYFMGGSGTWDIITRYPDLFAAAVPVTGVSDPLKVQLIEHIPIWAFHDQKYIVTLVQNIRNMVR